MIINLTFESEEQAVAILAARGIAATDHEVMPTTVIIDGVRVDVITHGVMSVPTGNMIAGPSVGGVVGNQIAEMASLPGYHVSVVWGGDNYPAFPAEFISTTALGVLEVPTVETVVDTSITWLEFLDLFSLNERVQVATSNDPYVAYFRMVATGLGSDMHINDPRVVQGLDALIAAGLIDAERKARVLARIAP